jgi:hypothetical protein
LPAAEDFRELADGSHRQLGRQAKFPADVLIDQLSPRGRETPRGLPQLAVLDEIYHRWAPCLLTTFTILRMFEPAFFAVQIARRTH